MRYVGGFIGLQIKYLTKKNELNFDYYFAYARHSLSYVLTQTNARKIFLPEYLCDSIVDVCKDKKIKIEYYRINSKLEPISTPANIGKDELFLYINYFGIKNSYIVNLEKIMSSNLVIDNSHDLSIIVSKNYWIFNSFRKFLGVPDGSLLVSPKNLSRDCNNFKKNYPQWSHLILRTLQLRNMAYKRYLNYENQIPLPTMLGSTLSLNLVSRMNLQKIATRRKNNFLTLHNILKDYNFIEIDINGVEFPYAYPFLPSQKKLNKIFLKHKMIFVPNLWNNSHVILKSELAETMGAHLLPLPIDQRYSQSHMVKIASTILKSIKSDIPTT